MQSGNMGVPSPEEIAKANIRATELKAYNVTSEDIEKAKEQRQALGIKEEDPIDEKDATLDLALRTKKANATWEEKQKAKADIAKKFGAGRKF